MSVVLASWFGSGFVVRRFTGSDLGAGTLGAVVAFPMSLLVGNIAGSAGQAAVLVLVTLAGLWAVRRQRAVGDAGWIVIDEAAGTFVATIGLVGLPAIVGFVVFRAADILKKPFPGVSQAERLPAEWGVMTDDLVAGLYGLVAGLAVKALI